MAIYKPILFSPNVGEARDMSGSQIFSATLSSRTTDYQLKIYSNDDGTLLYDSTKITLAETLFSDDLLQHTVPITPAISGYSGLKWTLKVFNGTESIPDYQLREIYFVNAGSPQVSLTIPSIIESQSYTFIANYSHPQNTTPLRFKYTLYDSVDNYIKDSGWIYKESLKYTFEDFLNTSNYKIKVEVYDINGEYGESPLYDFSVSYNIPAIIFKPQVDNSEEGCILIKWPGTYSLPGDYTNNIIYEPDFINDDNFALKLPTVNDEVFWQPVDVKENFSVSFLWASTQENFSGNIISLVDSTNPNSHYILGFENERFYKITNGTKVYSNEVFPFSSVNIYYILIYKDLLYVKSVAYQYDWASIAENYIWDDIKIYTWQDVLIRSF